MSKLAYGKIFNVKEYLTHEQFKEAIFLLELTKTQKILMFHLYEYADENGKLELPQAFIAKLCHISVRQCSRIYKHLRQIGLITTEKTSNYYVTAFAYNPAYDYLLDKKTVPKKGKKKPPKAMTDFLKLKDELFEKIRTSYHPSRANLQTITARNEFDKACREVSKTYQKNEAKSRAVKEQIYNKMMGYIDHLKTTDAWTEQNGKYLLGLGNMIKNGAWRNLVVSKEGCSEEKQALKNIFGS